MKRLNLLMAHILFSCWNLQSAQEHEIIRFSSLLDTCMEIWHDSCLLLECEKTDTHWRTMNDLVIGRLTRLKHDIVIIQQESEISHTVLISDFEYLVTILKQMEDEYKEYQMSESIILLTRSIREHIAQLL